MKKMSSLILEKLKKLNLEFLLPGFLFILGGMYTWATGKLPKGGVIYDDDLKIIYAFVWFILGIACIFVGLREK